MRRTLAITLVLLVALSLQTSVLPALNLGWAVLLPLALLVYAVMFGSSTTAYVVAFVGGFLLDLYSSFPFGTYLVTFLCIALFTEFLYLRFFTNHSFYGILVLSLTAGLATQLILWMLSLTGVTLLHLGTPYDPRPVLLGRVIGTVTTTFLVFYSLYGLGRFVEKNFFVKRKRSMPGW